MNIEWKTLKNTVFMWCCNCSLMNEFSLVFTLEYVQSLTARLVLRCTQCYSLLVVGVFLSVFNLLSGVFVVILKFFF